MCFALQQRVLDNMEDFVGWLRQVASDSSQAVTCNLLYQYNSNEDLHIMQNKLGTHKTKYSVEG